MLRITDWPAATREVRSAGLARKHDVASYRGRVISKSTLPPTRHKQMTLSVCKMMVIIVMMKPPRLVRESAIVVAGGTEQGIGRISPP